MTASPTKQSSGKPLILKGKNQQFKKASFSVKKDIG